MKKKRECIHTTTVLNPLDEKVEKTFLVFKELGTVIFIIKFRWIWCYLIPEGFIKCLVLQRQYIKSSSQNILTMTSVYWVSFLEESQGGESGRTVKEQR